MRYIFVFLLGALMLNSCNSQDKISCSIENEKLYQKIKFRKVSEENTTYANLSSVSILNLQCDSTNVLAILNRFRVLSEKNREREQLKLLNSIDFEKIQNVSSFFKNELRYKLALLKIKNADTLNLHSLIEDIQKEQIKNSNYFSETNAESDTILFLTDDFLLSHREMHFYIVNANIIAYIEGAEHAKKYLDNKEIDKYLKDSNIDTSKYQISNYAIRQEYEYNPIKWLNKMIWL